MFSLLNHPFSYFFICGQDLHRHNAYGGSWVDCRRSNIVANQKTCFLCMTLNLNLVCSFYTIALNFFPHHVNNSLSEESLPTDKWIQQLS